VSIPSIKAARLIFVPRRSAAVGASTTGCGTASSTGDESHAQRPEQSLATNMTGSQAMYGRAHNVNVARRWCSPRPSPHVAPPQQCGAEQAEQRCEHEADERELKDGRW
jgi:hypothetical protein